MALIHLLQIGILSCLWNFSFPFASLLAYLAIYAGYAIQSALLRKSAKPLIRWIFCLLLAAAALLCECAWFIWDHSSRYGVMICYGSVLFPSIGAALAGIISWVRAQKQ